MTVEQEATYAITPPVRVNSEGSISNVDREKKAPQEAVCFQITLK